jgi:hypothetical protein
MQGKKTRGIAPEFNLQNILRFFERFGENSRITLGQMAHLPSAIPL